VLGKSVVDRLVGDYYNYSTCFQGISDPLQTNLQRLDFPIHLKSQTLK